MSDARENGREQARKRYPAPLGPCEYEGGCDAEATDRHHLDGDTWHNERENIAFLCRRHHMLIDGRLEALARCITPIKPPRPCTNCARPSKPIRKGRCGACNEYLRRTGEERPVDPATGEVLLLRGYGAVPPGWKPGVPLPNAPVHACEHCQRTVTTRFAKGRCKRCYEYRRLRGYDRPLAPA